MKKGVHMTGHVFVFSEWLAHEGKEEELYLTFKKLMALTHQKEKGCLRAHALKQISHPAAPGTSTYTIVLHQEYENREAFNTHCAAVYVKEFIKTYIENKETALVKEWRCRLFKEDI